MAEWVIQDSRGSTLHKAGNRWMFLNGNYIFHTEHEARRAVQEIVDTLKNADGVNDWLRRYGNKIVCINPDPPDFLKVEVKRAIDGNRI